MTPRRLLFVAALVLLAVFRRRVIATVIRLTETNVLTEKARFPRS